MDLDVVHRLSDAAASAWRAMSRDPWIASGSVVLALVAARALIPPGGSARRFANIASLLGGGAIAVALAAGLLAGLEDGEIPLGKAAETPGVDTLMELQR